MRDLPMAAIRLLGLSWRQSRSRTATATGLMLVSGAAMPLAAACLRRLIDSAQLGRVTEAVVAGLLIAVLLIAALTLAHFAHLAYFELAELNLLRYDEELINLVNGSPGLQAHEDPAHADRFTIVEQEVQQTRNALQALMSLAGLATGMTLTTVLLVALHPLLLLLPLVSIPPLLAGRRAEQRMDRARKAGAAPTRLALNLFRLATNAGSAKELSVLRLRSEIRRRHAHLWAGTTARLWQAHWRGALLRAAGQLVFAAGYVAAVVLVVREAAAGRSTVGDVALVVMLAAQVNSQVAQVVALAPDIQRLTGVDRRLAELRQAIVPTPEIGRFAPAPPPQRLTRGITLRGVSLSYQGTLALREVDLHLPASATVAIVGENGAGKTSIISLLCGLHPPAEGQILIDGTPLDRIALDAWRARIAVGFQDFVRYEFTAHQSVGVGDLPRMDSEEAVLAALARARVGDVIPQLPGGLGTRLGKSHADGIELSGGQWQKLALGRAFMRERPLLLVLDEPTSALDPEAEHALFECYAAQAARTAADGGITVLVSHRLSTVRVADLIVVVSGGRIAESGDHATLMRKGGLYAELYGMQARSYR
ncbi:ABC transporter ATP-binding protein [Nonomuraea diastatica]|uniref:ABC transporter ATP-binding protein n=1 Tax=Nonomuraea diastatica TaxID=1848329 RepID=A0A4R4X0Y1_9ACTN|nr:ABC transporter ATP-binding protein [Nonomuraea diastatica]TDD23826.1 ABC transporter ATP-binding protein [Nonomuraea diastatica]